MKTFRRSRSGISLVEVMVVVAIIALLIAIAMPAFWSVQEQSRRSHCKNNMRQFASAFLGFAASNGEAFPSGMTLEILPPLLPSPNVRVRNYMVELLPYCEQVAVYDMYKMDSNFFDPVNANAVSATLPFAICPSVSLRDFSPEIPFSPAEVIPASVHQNSLISKVINALEIKYSTRFRGGLTDYSVIAWIDKSVPADFGRASETNWGLGIEGLFPYPVSRDYKGLLRDLSDSILSNKPVVLSQRRLQREMIDGASKTIMLIEGAGRPGRWEHGRRTGREEPVVGGAWADFRNLMRVKGAGGNNHCLLACDNRDGPYSFHTGMVNTLFADGHVDGIGTDMDGRVFISLVSVDDGDN